MAGRSLFTLTLALGTAYRVMIGATTSTSTVLGTYTTDTDFSVSFSDSSSYYSNSYSYNYDFHPDYPDCDSSYALSYIGDGYCDTFLNVAECGWDGGDCCACTCNSSYSYYCTSDYYCEDPSAPVYLGDLGCQNTTYQVPQAKSCPEDQDIWVINSAPNATALAEATLCSGGYFEVEWLGHIDVNTTIHVLNGTHLHINGTSDAMADGGRTVQIFLVHNGSLYLNNIGIVNGAGSEGGAIILAAGSELFADGVVFRSNTATHLGGAVYASSSSIELVSTTFDGNSARNGGAMFVHNSEVIADGNTNFYGNSVSDNGGGAVYALSSSIELASTTFDGNSARNGGAMFMDDSIMNGSGNTLFNGNRVSGNGGALYITGYSEVRWNMRAVIINTTVNYTYTSYDTTYTYSYDTTYTTWTAIEDSGETAFLNNIAEGFGGAMYLDDSEIFLSGTSSLEQNKAWSGGALYLEGGTTVSSEGVAIFASNEAISDGGAIGGTAGSFSDNGSTMFVNNTSGENGGAIDITNIDFSSTGTLLFLNNSAVFGGALYASQKNVGPTLINVTFSGNIAEYGGAVFFSAVGTSPSVYYYSFYYYYNDVTSYSSSSYWSTFDGCRFDGNSASSTGGAIHSVAGNDYIANSIFEGNSADIGGGLSVSGTVYLFNSSFEDNRSGDGGGPAISNGGVISNMTKILFSGNGYHCLPDAFLEFNEATVDNTRYGIVCDGCDIECEGCTVEDNHTIPVCSDLLEHTDSRDGTATLETLDVDPGYWRATNTSRIILPCFYKKACKGGVTGNPEYCLKGYEGPYCAVCSQGYVRTLSHRCSECSSNTTLGTAVFGVFVGFAGVLLLLFLYYMIRIERGRTTRNSTSRLRKILAIQSFKIIIVSWQIITQFSAVANVVYPSLYEDFLDVVALVNFDFSWLLSAGCLDVDFYVGLIAATAGPVAVLALLGVTYTIALRRNHGSQVGRRFVRRKHINAIILIAFLVYSSASSAVFRTFSCDRLDDGNVYLRTDYRIECDSSKHRAFMVYSGLMIIVYPLGIPMFFAIVLFRNRRFLGNATLRTYNGELVQQSTSSLWKPYKPSAFYYEIVECVRRLLLAGILVFIYPDTAAQIAVTLAMAFIFAVVSERLNPYESKWDGWVARIGHVMVVLTMIVALLSKVDVSDEDTQSQNMFAGILVTAHIAMVLTGVTEAAILIHSVQETDSPLPRPRRMHILPVDSFASIRLSHGDEGFENETGQKIQ